MKFIKEYKISTSETTVNLIVLLKDLDFKGEMHYDVSLLNHLECLIRKMVINGIIDKNGECSITNLYNKKLSIISVFRQKHTLWKPELPLAPEFKECPLSLKTIKISSDNIDFHFNIEKNYTETNYQDIFGGVLDEYRVEIVADETKKIWQGIG